jgi:hypothetical protein
VRKYKFLTFNTGTTALNKGFSFQGIYLSIGRITSLLGFRKKNIRAAFVT